MTSPGSSGFLSPTSLPREDELLMKWPFNLETYVPSLTFGNDVSATIHEFEKIQLSRETAVQCLRYTENYLLHDEMLSDDLLKKSLASSNRDFHKIFFIKRFIMKANTERYPKDIKRLRISKLSFRRLLSHFEVPPAFIKPMLSTSLASLSYHHRKLTVRKRPIIDFFYVLPVRVAVTCDEVERSHILSSAGSNQMNPSQYLHLTDVHRDIRPSKIAVYLQHDEACHQTSTICIDFQDGRAEYSDFADEPLLRAREVLQRATRAKNCEDPFFIHLVLLTSVAEWWRCALMWFNAQLIVYEKQLQQQMYHPDDMPDDFINETNKTLHTMVAHLHRYRTETDILEAIATSLATHCHCSCTTNESRDPPTVSQSNSRKTTAPEKSSSGQDCQPQNPHLLTLITELRTIRNFLSELSSKAQTTLALLFNNIRTANDKLLVANGDSMRRLLQASSEEARLSRQIAKQSQKMAVDMRRDSTSMKTIAILTMFFLPATSFAAVLSMPFFAQDSWMGKGERAWLWVVLSVPSTMVAFGIFWFYVRKGDKEIQMDEKREHGVENGS